MLDEKNPMEEDTKFAQKRNVKEREEEEEGAKLKSVKIEEGGGEGGENYKNV